jgi:hypothetical protein
MKNPLKCTVLRWLSEDDFKVKGSFLHMLSGSKSLLLLSLKRTSEMNLRCGVKSRASTKNFVY